MADTTTDFVVSVHIAQLHQHSAAAFLRRTEFLEGPFDRKVGRWPTKTINDLAHLERFAPGVRMPEIVDRLVELIGQMTAAPTLVADISEVGRPILTLMEARKLRPVAVHVGELTNPRSVRRAMIIPKRDLISCTNVLLGERRLRVPREHPESETLARELQQYRLQRPSTNKPWERAENDDLVIAISVASWWSENLFTSRVHQPPPPKIPPPPHRPPTFLEAFKTAQKQASGRNRI